jgi:hypothetical protein
MSFIIFQPLAVQLLQQSLDLGFNQAVASLGVNIVFLTYARAGVAVFLGAILALTNTADEATQVRNALRPTRRFAWLRRLLHFIAARFRKQPALATPVTVNEEKPALEVKAPAELAAATEEATEQIEVPAQPEPTRYDTPEQRAAKVSEIDFTGLSVLERVAKVLELFPNLSDRELGKLSGMAPATAKKYRAVKGAMSNG